MELELLSYLLCFVFVVMDFFFFLIWLQITYCSLVLLIMSPGGRLHRFDLGYNEVSEICNWCFGRLDAREILLKEEEMYMLEETVNVGLEARSLSAEAGPGPLSLRLVVMGWSGRQCQLFLIYVYIFTNPSARAGYDTRSIFKRSFPSPRLVASPRLKNLVCPTILPIAGGRIIGFIPFPMVLVLCEMQSVTSRIWTRVAESISYDDNHYTTGTSWYMYIVFFWKFMEIGSKML